MFLSSLLAGIVEHSRRRAPLMALLGVLLAALSGWYASGHLGVSTDTDLLFSASLPWRQREIAFNAAFPQFQDQLVAVIDAEIPEEAEQTAADLSAALQRDPAHFSNVQRPDASPYLEANAFLFLDAKALSSCWTAPSTRSPSWASSSPTQRARPVRGPVAWWRWAWSAAKPTSARSPRRCTRSPGPGRMPPPGSRSRCRGRTLLGGSLADLAGPYRFVLCSPSSIMARWNPAAQRRRRSAMLPPSSNSWPRGQARVRITGSVALADEEFATVAQGRWSARIGERLLVVLWLVLAVRSWRLIVPIVLTLILGLLLTTGFAALAVGTLNLISVAFAILFVGIAVDFAIQFSVRFREVRLTRARPGPGRWPPRRAWSGPQIMVAAAATAAGFLAFVPTSFSGVAELGLIAGVGMVIAFLSTILFLPAALALFRPRPERAEVGLAAAQRAGGGAPACPLARPVRVRPHSPLPGAVLLPRLQFDSDPLHTKDPNTEAMTDACTKLLAIRRSPIPTRSTSYSPPRLRPTRSAKRIEPLPLVAQVLTLSSFVPEDQPAKLALLADAVSVLGPTLAPRSPPAPITPADLRLAAKGAQTQIARVVGQLPADSPLLRDRHGAAFAGERIR